MPFFARPDLSDEQFKQLKGSELTLSGQTRIATTSGLTLVGDSGYIPIVATGATNDFVLTYDGGENVIKLKQSTVSGGTGTYPYNECSTCTVGGLVAPDDLYNRQVVDILHDILVPTLEPVVTSFSNSLSIFPTTIIYEVGCTLSLTGTSSFDRGCVDPQYCGGSAYVAGLPTTHVYYPFWNPAVSACTTQLSTGVTFVQCITSGTNPLCAEVAYSSGDTPIYNSSGCTICAAEPAGTTPYVTQSLCGIFPWFWGIEASGGAPAGGNRPTACCVKDIITGCTYAANQKCVAASTGTISTTFGSTNDDYLWFAIPTGSTSKTCWYIDALNNALIGGAVNPGGNLFPDPDIVTGVTSTVWAVVSESPHPYKIYVSNYQSCSTSVMQLRNS